MVGVAVRKLTGIRKLAVLAVPWAFLAVFASLYLVLVWPRAVGGNALAIGLTIFLGMVFLAFTIAAFTFSGDVIAGRYPADERRS
jgi:hypothetical protein